jgi:hypothetical protein
LGILADKAAEQLGIKDVAALAGIIAGQPYLKKRFVTPGSSSETSSLAKFLSNKVGTSPVRLPTIVANSGRVGIAMTKSVGKFTARWIPFIGWGYSLMMLQRSFTILKWSIIKLHLLHYISYYQGPSF